MQSAKRLREQSSLPNELADRDSSSCANVPGKIANELSRSRPFIERRRRRQASQSWEEALECLQMHLSGFEAANERLRESGESYREIFENAPIGMFQINLLGQPLRLNTKMARIFGYESLQNLLEDTAGEEAPVLIDPAQLSNWESTPDPDNIRSGIEVKISCPNGQMKWVRLNLRAIHSEGQITHFEGTGEDITDRKRVEIRNQRLAYYDRVTGLPNRTQFNEGFDEAITAAKRSKEQAALVLVKIDRFKVINDSLGTVFGDRLLKEVADRIRSASGEKSIVARVGGAEFAIILPKVSSALAAHAIGSRITVKLNEDFTFLGHCLSVMSYGGISMFPEHGDDRDTLMKRAEVALEASHEEGSNQIRAFTAEMNAEMLERIRLENGLRMALNRSEFFLVYQPQVDSRTGALTGLEALLRWQHPQMGLIPPTKFIGIAENTGLIVPIGEWVLRTACQQVRQWQDKGLITVPVAVNVSALQFRQQGFGELVQTVLKETGLDPKYLELELTESLLLTNADVMFSTIQELKDMGVMLAIDDFGTGYSSLSYLRQFKVNRLKISRSFVQDISTNSDDAAITNAIIHMAKALNLAVLAEGVENEEQLSILGAQQCFTIQGFYFSKPIRDEQLITFLQSGYVKPAVVVG